MIKATFEQCELFKGLEGEQLARFAAIVKHQALPQGEYLFLLGDNADRLFVVAKGRIDVCLPLSFGGTLKDVVVETREPGHTLGWSALVRPYRFTRSARAAEASEVLAFTRTELQQVLDADCRLGLTVMNRVAEVIGRRLLTLQALLARELQRSVAGGWPDMTQRPT